MTLFPDFARDITRRHFFAQGSHALGWAALTSLMGRAALAAPDAINHEPAIACLTTGNQVTGRPCLGSWASYGLGSLNDNLPTFVVLVAKPTNTEQVQAISARLWSAGHLPGEHAGVSFRAAGDPILFINNPPGVSQQLRRETPE